MLKKTIIIGIIFVLIIPINSTAKLHLNNYESNEVSLEYTPDIVVEELINMVYKDLLKKYLTELVEFGPRFTGTENCHKAAQFIFNEFEKLGLETYIDLWEYPDYKCQNVVATHKGTDLNSDAIFIICAHYDTTEDSPDANDDGSGVASILSIANLCSQYLFNYTIRFIAFSGEEVGTCGSHSYAKKAYERGDNIIAVLNLETFGYTSSGGKELFILKTDRTNWISEFSRDISEKYYDLFNLNIITNGNRPCDHQAFLEYGYDAVQYVQLNRNNYPLHSPGDSLDKINFSYLTNVTKLILAITVELVLKPIELQIRITTPYEGYFYIMDNHLIQLPGYNIGYSGLRGMTYMIGKGKIRVDITTNLEIESVFFCVDGVSEFLGECKEPPYEWKIQKTVWSRFPLKGKHTIGAYVWTKDGKVAYDEMDIFLFQLI